MTYEEFKAYQRKYKKLKYKQVSILLKLGEDEDLIKYLNGKESKAGYVKELIRKDMKEADDEGDGVSELRQGV